MLRIPPAPPFLRRERKTMSTPTPPAALVIVSATILWFEGADAAVRLLFDTTEADPIVDVEAAVGAKWSATIEGYAFVVSAPLDRTAFDAVVLYMGNAGESEGANRISYAADPSDIKTASGRMLAGFEDRPLENP